MRLIYFLLAMCVLCSKAKAFDDCRTDIKNRIYTGAYRKKIKDPKIIGMFEQAYDLMPEQLHPLFCSIPKFRLVKNYDTSADSTMGIRAAFFDRPSFSASQWLTWKEQLNYGVKNDDSFSTDALFPSVEVTINGAEISFLYPILVHELAHNLPRPNGFGSRWSSRHDKYSSIVPEEFCFYWCDQTSVILKPSQSEEIFKRLYTQTDWINAYGQGSEEDFAHSFTYYVLIQKNGQHSDYRFKIPNGSSYSVRRLMSTALWAEKMNLLAEAFANLPTEVIKLPWDHSRCIEDIQAY